MRLSHRKNRSINVLKYLFLTLPLFWVLGLEQIVPMVFIGIAGGFLLATNRKISIPRPLRFALIFLLWQVFSLVSIDRDTNYVVFAKNFITFLVGWVSAVIIANGINNEVEAKEFLKSVIWFIVISDIIGLLYLLNILPESFNSLSKPIIQPILGHSQFVQDNVLLRSIGKTSTKFGDLTVSRVSLVFLFPTGAALAYLIIIPLFIFFRKIFTRQFLTILLAVASLVILVFTFTRSAYIILPTSILIALFVRKQYRVPKIVKPAVVLGAFFAVSANIFLFRSEIVNIYQALFVNIRKDSLTSRVEVYKETIHSLNEHLLVGWGTPRAIDSVQLAPLGTHNEYLFIIYSFGIMGFIFYSLFWVSMWKRALLGMDFRINEGRENTFQVAVFISFLNIFLNGFVQGNEFDLSNAILVWMIFGLICSPLYYDKRRKISQFR